MSWKSLRKGSAGLHITYGKSETGNLCVENVRVRTAPSLDLSFELNRNLRTRNRSTNSYQDARELADGAIADLKVVQITDNQVLERLSGLLARAHDVPSVWTLTVELEGPHTFRVRPEWDPEDGSLSLHVEST